MRDVAFLLGAASGGAVGSLMGAMVDGLVPGRQTLYEKSGIRLAPVLTPTQKGGRLTFDWR